jgi:ferrous iron transport protein A
MKTMLSDLGIGESAVVTGFSKENRMYRKKLLAMGVTPGVSLQVLRYAALGDPMEITVRGFGLSLRRSEADTVFVERTGA